MRLHVSSVVFLHIFEPSLSSSQASFLKRSVLMNYFILKSFLCRCLKDASSICKVVALCRAPKRPLANMFAGPGLGSCSAYCSASCPGSLLCCSFLPLQQTSWAWTAHSSSYSRCLDTHQACRHGCCLAQNCSCSPGTLQRFWLGWEFIHSQFFQVFVFTQSCQALPCTQLWVPPSRASPFSEHWVEHFSKQLWPAVSSGEEIKRNQNSKWMKPETGELSPGLRPQNICQYLSKRGKNC